MTTLHHSSRSAKQAQAETSQEHLTRRLLQQMAGDRNTITLHKFIIDVCDGDHLKALLVEQLMYWSERSRSADGEVAKSDADWHDELRLSPRQMRRIRDWLKKSSVAEVARKRSPYYGGQPVYHYALNWKVLQAQVKAKLTAELDEPVSSELPKNASSEVNEPASSEGDGAVSSERDQPASSFTEPTTEPTPKKKSVPPAKAAATNGAKPATKPRKRNAMFDAIVMAFGYDAETLTKNESSLIGTVAAQLTTAQVTPEDVASLYAWCKRQGWKTWGPGALTTNVSNWRKTARPNQTAHPASDWETFA